MMCLLAAIMLLPVRAQAVSTQASSAILMDGESGRVLYGQDIHQPRLIASITKLMTALVAAERCKDPEEEIIVLPEWTGIEGSSIYLVPGEKVTFRELLYGMLLQSGNDAAVAAACWIAGDEASFADLMNQKAAELGMTNSSFANASGLNQEGHYSTAYDMALLAQACLQNELVAAACAARSITIGARTFVNHNKLLHRYDGCIGMKTGYTERAGRTLVSAARRNGQTLICVTLNDADDWNDHEKLFDYGFSVYPNATLCEERQGFGRIAVEGSLLPTVEIAAIKQVRYPLKEGEYPEIAVEKPDRITAPFLSGETVGKVIWTLNGEKICETDLISVHGAGRDLTVSKRLRDRFLSWMKF